jgi:hypothetical protein
MLGTLSKAILFGAGTSAACYGYNEGARKGYFGQSAPFLRFTTNTPALEDLAAKISPLELDSTVIAMIPGTVVCLSNIVSKGRVGPVVAGLISIAALREYGLYNSIHEINGIGDRLVDTNNHSSNL